VLKKSADIKPLKTGYPQVGGRLAGFCFTIVKS